MLLRFLAKRQLAMGRKEEMAVEKRVGTPP
jgi:hypothetical protein